MAPRIAKTHKTGMSVREGKLLVVDHPLVKHKLTLMRDKTCNNRQFRTLVKEVRSVLRCSVLAAPRRADS